MIFYEIRHHRRQLQGHTRVLGRPRRRAMPTGEVKERAELAGIFEHLVFRTMSIDEVRKTHARFIAMTEPATT